MFSGCASIASLLYYILYTHCCCIHTTRIPFFKLGAIGGKWRKSKRNGFTFVCHCPLKKKSVIKKNKINKYNERTKKKLRPAIFKVKKCKTF